MKKKLVIFGTDIIAKMVYLLFARDSDFEIVAFTVDQKYLNVDVFFNLPVVPFENVPELYPPSDFEMFIAIGPSKMNVNRANKCTQAKSLGYKLASYISPYAICDSEIGENTIVADYAIIHPYVKIGDNNGFWEQCFIANDTVIGNNCWFSPKSVVSTFAEVNDNTILGTGSIVKTSIKIAKKTLVGAASYISANTEENGVYGEKTTSYYGNISEKINISL
jgi:sugar O-acyltransferase (sialic acid O-acetyltransferase NeuD family)